MFEEGKEAVLAKTEATWDMISLLMIVHAWNYDGQVRGSHGTLKLHSTNPRRWMRCPCRLSHSEGSIADRYL